MSRTRLAVVTGATGGIGSAIAHRLAEDGFEVMVGYHRSAEKAQALADRLEGTGHWAHQVTVTDRESVAALAAAIGERTATVDVLVNSAGMTRPVPHDDLDGLADDLIDEIFATNWRGPFALIRALRPYLDAVRGQDLTDPSTSGDSASGAATPPGSGSKPEAMGAGAVVVNISSIAGVTGVGSNVAYCASKAALDSLTRSLARALAPTIRVVSVSPGWVRGEYADRMPPEVLAAQENATPLRRLATPQDVAAAVSAAVLHLGFTTGSVIPVDGGRPLGI